MGSLRSFFRKLRRALKRRPVVINSIWHEIVVSNILRSKLPDVAQVHCFKSFWEIPLTDETLADTRKLLETHDFDALINYSTDAKHDGYPRIYLGLAYFRNEAANLFFALIYDSDILEQDPELLLYEPA